MKKKKKEVSLDTKKEFYSFKARSARENSYKHGNGFTISIQTSSECNFRCTYCYEKKKKGSIQLDDVYSVIDKLLHYNDYPNYWKGYLCKNISDFTFDFFGGECLLEIDKISDICDYFLNACKLETSGLGDMLLNNFKIILQTNGYLLSTKKVRDFLTKWEDHITIATSLDGNKEFHDKCRVLKDSGLGTYDIVKKNILKTRNDFPRLKSLAVRSTISSDSLPFLYNAFLELESLGMGDVSMPLALGVEWKEGDDLILKDQLKLIIDHLLQSNHIPTFAQLNGGGIEILDRLRLYTNMEKNSFFLDALLTGTCYLDGRGISIDTDGNLYPCIQFSELTIPNELGRKRLTIGNAKTGITDEGIKLVNKLKNSYDKHVIENEKCNMCTAKISCEYCPAFSYKVTGDVTEKLVPECQMRKTLISMGALYRLRLESKKWKRSENFI